MVGVSGNRGGMTAISRRAHKQKPGDRPVFASAPLPRSFYARPVLQVARDCIGKTLVHRSPDGVTVGRIVEAEAYRGPEDRAAHSWNGRRTPRTEVMFGPPGYAYVFFVYGMHHNFNIVTGRVGEPHAVLIRAVEPMAGLDLMARRRGVDATRRELTNGPGKLCQAFAIHREHNGADLCASDLVLLPGAPVGQSARSEAPANARARVVRSPRVGIDYAGSWAAKLWRFFDPDSAYVSRPRPLRAVGVRV
jgi:DNA-3-methyladenine glycosylase